MVNLIFFLISQDPDGLNMTAREMSLVEGYVSASDFLLTSKIQDIPVWLIREIIRSGLMVSSRVVRWASGSSAGGP
jgi:hypothetical protein